MDLEELRAFLAVVETGSFLTAAKVLKLSRGTLRRRVDELEIRAGIPLLERTRLGAVATEAGAVLAARGRLLVQEAGALLESVRDIGAEPSGVVRIMLPVGLPPQILTPIAVTLRARYPALAFRVRFSDHPVGELLDDVDLAIHFGTQGPQGPFIVHEIFHLKVWLIASSDYLRRRGTPRSIDDLAHHDLLSWELPGEDGQLWPTRSGGVFKVAPKLMCADIHLLRHCAIVGLGIALVPDAMLPDPGLPEEALCPVLPDLVGKEIAVRLMVPKVLSESPKIKAVLNLIQPFLASI